MPGWHDQTKELRESGEVQMIGIIQEQHPERCRLFMQWKEMGWPVLVDRLNLLEVPLVPITLAIDENGIIQKILGPPIEAGDLSDGFLNHTSGKGVAAEVPSRPTVPAPLADGASLAEVRSFADEVVLWGGTERLGEAIEAYKSAVVQEPKDGSTLFRLGVAYRMRYDSPDRQSNDFHHAVSSWDHALQTDPNNYIWRRRIQQYGPRMDKPYPFYNWMESAIEEIRSRGEKPIALEVEPRGAELAEYSEFMAGKGGELEPDPGGQILRDRGRFIQIESAVAPPAVEPGGTARIHLIFRPNVDNKAHWNNEVEEALVWVGVPEGWEVEGQVFKLPNPTSETSDEIRRLEFEVRAPVGRLYGAGSLTLYALYYVCEDRAGVCLYRRQDIPVRVDVRENSP